MASKDYIKWIRGKVGHEKIIIVYAGGCIFNESGEVLLQKRADCNKWGFPGGALELGETPEMAAKREVKEETGLDVEVGKLIGIYTDCDVVCANGDQVQSICIGYEMTVVGGSLVCDKVETLELKYFPLDDMPELFCKQHEELLRDIKVKDLIRLAEEKDFLQLAEMKWEHSAEDDITYGETNIVGVDKQGFINDYITFLKNDSTYTIFVLEQDGVIISAMYVAIIDKVPKPKVNESYIAYLTNVHTMQEYRNKGYGTELLSYIKNYLKEKGCELIFVWPSNNSVNWYSRNGFKAENDIMECEF